MDNIDRKILAELQSDGRLSITDLAEKVGLSLSPCHRRLRALEDSGIIKGYCAQLEPSRIGLNFSTIVFVTMKDGDKNTVAKFEETILDIPNITQAQRLFGDPDYLLHVVSSDLSTFQKLYDEKLSALPGVKKLTTTMIMKSVISDRLFPL
ncbi:Lrp/AsnC family transcriptional regulator [Acinetobacter sp. C_4_1]|uniref:Lrp/AsnC family transcriptional regulator n=1 Tax=unclassified Acinetobacter TaxID=196816 RepID=UPI0021B82310|nr:MULTISPECIES: Lrp/AsnC family transcriptional regulator [unclassified Acinetobacter]MCT8088354.1 Lrp/AsnC family transcriptional regulator [Acinetobacter sp. F_3_1]MCT8097723.1 Lrp/AsnC family transcriptional regulator [Acinetobacter sp. C_3_1]MCT8100379.1 Lrp/AsnC family transcriptional regulator [Acinetobacter sp. C_4_1]MCT8133902.1 Lrp/AsnC family transcriptional regulator [Acinetobacter sp. T_3_1]